MLHNIAETVNSIYLLTILVVDVMHSLHQQVSDGNVT